MRTGLCSECKYSGLDHPCKDDPSILAKAYIDGDAFRATDDGHNHWAWECMFNAVHLKPEFAMAAILHIYPKIDTPEKAAIFAGGHLENLCYAHGATAIDQCEVEAEISEKFAYLLSGVWPPLDEDDDVNDDHWVRLRALQAKGPHMDRSDPLPES